MIENGNLILNNSMAEVSLLILSDCRMINDKQLLILQEIIADRKNILISGPVGSGKSTLLQAISNTVCVASSNLNSKVVIIQSADEIKPFKLKHSNYTSLIAKPPFDLAPVIDAGLRLNHDLLVVGDLRTTEIKELLNSDAVWASCINADSPLSALHNLEEYSKLSGYLPSKKQIAAQVNVVVHVECVNAVHQVTSISLVTDFAEGGFTLTKLG